jgi:hypothetical protein
MTTATTTTMTKAEWLAKGEELFGANTDAWKFACPVCGNVASVGDFREHKDKGAEPSSATNECIGRYLPREGVSRAIDWDNANEGKPDKPCDYAGYGLFRLSPIVVVDGDTEVHSFAFAEVTP